MGTDTQFFSIPLVVRHRAPLWFLLFWCFLSVPILWAQNAQNPIIWADVPDPSMVRVGDTYYMVSTTMHMNPGIPIMKSKNLVDWELVHYVYDKLIDNASMNLNEGQNAYGKGSWASSIVYHQGTFYIHTFSYTSGKSHIFKTQDIENGPFTATTLSSLSHDASLLFDEDGRVYLAYGHDDITLRELKPDLSDYQPSGVHQVIIPKASSVAGANMILTAEGTQMFKINGWYYVMNICWPSGSGLTVVLNRSKNLTGPYEGRVSLNDQGVAQGGMISTPEGQWYAYLFQDHGAVGRIPYLTPILWEKNWPVFQKVPAQLDIAKQNTGGGHLFESDHFETLYKKNNGLKQAWQWNHNPVNSFWSLTERPGYLRLTNDRVDADLMSTHNTLTQKTFGPECTATVALDVQNMNEGDVAGLAAFQYDYGYVGVQKNKQGLSLVMVNGTDNKPQQKASIPIQQNRVYLRIRMDFKNKTDKAYFYYSLDGSEWHSVGNTLQMKYSLKHFMGYRMALFNMATLTAGGSVDFDYYQVNDFPFQDRNPLEPHQVPGRVEAEEYAAMSGILKELDSEKGFNLGWIDSGDWVDYWLEVPEKGTYSVKMNVATGADSNSKILFLNEKEEPLGELVVRASESDGWHDWYQDSTFVMLEAGIQKVRLVFQGPAGYLMNVDHMEWYLAPLPLRSRPFLKAQNLRASFFFDLLGRRNP